MTNLTRTGQAEAAVHIGDSLPKLATMSPIVMPGEGNPFDAIAWSKLCESPEWSSFLDEFRIAESSLNDSYLKALARERSNFQEKGDAYGVVAIEEEKKRIALITSGTPAQKTSVPGTSEPGTHTPEITITNSDGQGAITNQKEVERLLENTTWSIDSNKDFLFYFSKQGKGVSKLVGTIAKFSDREKGGWIVQKDGTVELLAIGPRRTFTLTSSTRGTLLIHNSSNSETLIRSFIKVDNDPDIMKALK